MNTTSTRLLFRPPPLYDGPDDPAGAEAVQACRRGDPRLGYYLDALRLSYGYHC